MASTLENTDVHADVQFLGCTKGAAVTQRTAWVSGARSGR